MEMDDLLLKHLNGTLSIEEKEYLHDKIATDPVWEKAFEATKWIESAIDVNIEKDLRSSMKNWDSESAKSDPKILPKVSKNSFSLIRNLLPYGVAASIIIITGYFLMKHFVPGNDISRDLVEEESNPSNSKENDKNKKYKTVEIDNLKSGQNVSPDSPLSSEGLASENINKDTEDTSSEPKYRDIRGQNDGFNPEDKLSGLGSGSMNQTLNKEKIIATFYQPSFEAPEVDRQMALLFERAEKRIRNNSDSSIDELVLQLKSVDKSKPYFAYCQYLIAHLYFVNGDFNAAERQWSILYTLKVYKEETEWYRTLTSIKAGTPARTESLLETILARPKHKFYSEAESLHRIMFEKKK